jgi:hypothetical protein
MQHVDAGFDLVLHRYEAHGRRACTAIVRERPRQCTGVLRRYGRITG